ncbi:hypothetical protein CDD80_5525 [Ophiocordyceps camponoti-rufipedis]|uniref:Cytochrome P450 n=1 Tax=Ophiocordyceps camponoti-rufipedis TaxID=2004952 RepID=A0A2C5YM44_9HYPO|nr:hypothetical protein CDD80_5525 [Ophiocordyceps camponoti-rufipedis]
MALPILLTWAVVLTAALSMLARFILRLGQKTLPLPPGPPGEPILGHLRIIPAYGPQHAYMRWSGTYGSDILSLRVLGKPIIVLNSARAAIDLLVKRGDNYSDRPRLLLYEIMGWDRTMSFMRHGARLRKHRRSVHASFQKSSIVRYQGFQEREAALVVRALLDRPAKWDALLKQFASALIFRLGFGIDVKDEDDPMIHIASDSLHSITHGGAPGGTPVDFFPLLRLMPRFLQDKSLKLAADWKWAVLKLHDEPFEAYIKSQKKTWSLMRDMLEQRQRELDEGEEPQMTIKDIKGATSNIYIAAQDTVWSALIVLVLGLMLHPEVQIKARRIMDEVVGRDRLPNFEDRPRLAYIDYIVQETLRWLPVTPLGIPHASLTDDEYRGYRIPAGSLVYANAWAMTHDESVYTRPDDFNPDRYAPLEQGGLGEPHPVGQFGFGRRLCIGKHLAEANLWMLAALLLSTTTVGKPLDDEGNEVEQRVKMTNGLVSRPERFDCRFLPRDDKAMAVLRQTMPASGECRDQGPSSADKRSSLKD